MNRFEQFACGQVFHSYPENVEFSFIIDLCENEEKREKYNDDLEDANKDEEQLILCEFYENEWWDNVPTILDSFISSCMYHFPELAGQ